MGRGNCKQSPLVVSWLEGTGLDWKLRVAPVRGDSDDFTGWVASGDVDVFGRGFGSGGCGHAGGNGGYSET